MSAHIDLPHFLPWLSFVSCWLALGFVAVLIHALARPWLLQIDPGQRATLLLRLAVLPVITAILVTALSFLPGIGGIVVDKHCLRDATCLRHIPVFCADVVHAALLTAGPVMLTGIGACLLYRCVSRSVSLNRGLRCLADIHSVAAGPAASGPGSVAAHGGIAVVETPKLFAYCAGFVRSRLVLSRGLIRALSPSELGAVIAHEQAHAARHDNARRLAALIGLWLVPQALSRRLLRDMALSSEFACDREAARRTGNVECVASAVRAIRQLQMPVVETLGAAFIDPADGAGSTRELDSRISELLDAKRTRLARGVTAGISIVVYLYAVTGLTELVHHLAEYLLQR